MILKNYSVTVAVVTLFVALHLLLDFSSMVSFEWTPMKTTNMSNPTGEIIVLVVTETEVIGPSIHS